jgi:hypothetical protein
VQEWLSIARITANRSQKYLEIKEYYWNIFASNELFDLWEDVYEMWLNGKLKDQNGKTWTKRSPKSINPTIFSCFKWNIIFLKIMQVLLKVKSDGQCPFEEHHSNISQKPLIDKVAFSYKS